MDRQAIHSRRRPKNVYSAVAACCVACLDIKFGNTYPRAVEMTCRSDHCLIQSYMQDLKHPTDAHIDIVRF